MACVGAALIVVAVGLLAMLPAVATIAILIGRRPDNQPVAPLPPESRPGGFPIVERIRSLRLVRSNCDGVCPNIEG